MTETDDPRSLWTFRPGLIGDIESVKGYEVEAADGAAGTVAWASYAPGESYLVVTRRHHLHPTHHVVPAAAVEMIDPSQKRLWLTLTLQEVALSPQREDPTTPMDVGSDFLAGLWPSWLGRSNQ
jgi:hypothetical protein